jgi:D-alanyl-D-alanine carboxypeptidase
MSVSNNVLISKAQDEKDPLGIESPSVLLMELSSGKVLYEKA